MSAIYSGIGMPDAGAEHLAPVGEPRPMRIRWADVSAWSQAPGAWALPQDDGRVWIVVWLRGGGRPIWFGTREAFFVDGETL